MSEIVYTQRAPQTHDRSRPDLSFQRAEELAAQFRAGSFSVDTSGLHAKFSTGTLHFNRDQSLDNREVMGRKVGERLMFTSAEGTVLAVDRATKCVYLCIPTMAGGFRLAYSGTLPLFRPEPAAEPTPEGRSSFWSRRQRTPAANTTPNTNEASRSPWNPFKSLQTGVNAAYCRAGEFLAAHVVGIRRAAAALLVGGAVLVGLFAKRSAHTESPADPRTDGQSGQREALVAPTPTHRAQEPVTETQTATAPAAREPAMQPDWPLASQSPAEVAVTPETTIAPDGHVDSLGPSQNQVESAAAVPVESSSIEGATLVPLPEEVKAATDAAPLAPTGRLLFADLIEPQDHTALSSINLNPLQGQPLPIVINGPTFSELISAEDQQILAGSGIPVRANAAAMHPTRLPSPQGIPLTALISDEDTALLGGGGLELPQMRMPIVTTTRISLPLWQLIDDGDRPLLGQIALFEPMVAEDPTRPISQSVAQRQEDSERR